MSGANYDRSDGVTAHNRIWNDPVREPLDEGTHFRLRLDVQGTEFRVYYDDQLIETWSDPLNTNPRGTIAFWTAYNRGSYIKRVRVYQRPRVDPTPVNEALRFVGLPILPVEGPKDHRPHGLGGSTWAAIGEKRYPGANLTDIPWPGRPSDEASADAQLEPKSSMYPAAHAYLGDGVAKAVKLLGCQKTKLNFPSNARTGALFPVPLSAYSSSGRTASSYRLVSAKGASYAAFHNERSTTDAERFDNYEVTAVDSSPFAIDNADGTVIVHRGSAIEAGTDETKHSLIVAATTSGFDSGWFTMLSLADLPDERSLREITLPEQWQAWLSSRDPALVDVNVMLRAADGPNQGMIFKSFGSTSWQHYT